MTHLYGTRVGVAVAAAAAVPDWSQERKFVSRLFVILLLLLLIFHLLCFS